MKPTKTFVKRAIWLAVTAVSVYLVIPSVIEVFSSWPELERLRSGSLAIMSVLILLSLVCFWILLGLCARLTQVVVDGDEPARVVGRGTDRSRWRGNRDRGPVPPDPRRRRSRRNGPPRA